MNDRKLIDYIVGHIEKADRGAIDDWQTWHQQGIAYIRSTYDDSAKELEFARIRFTPYIGLLDGPDPTPRDYAGAEQEGIADAVAQLKGALSYLRVRQPDAPDQPAVDIALLHPWFAANVAAQWASGSHRVAVEEAARTVEMQLKAKVGWEASGSELITESFAVSDPKPDRPRLRFGEYTKGDPSWTNAHEGAMHFGRGCFMRIRNLYQHTQEPPEVEALEALASISLLARWVEQATVQTHDGSSP